MKHLLIITLLLTNNILLNAQDLSFSDIAPGLKNKKQRSIVNKEMNSLIKRVIAETECSKEDISYIVVDKFNYWKKDEKNLPSTIIIKVHENKFTYIRNLPNSQYAHLRYWAESGKWILNSHNN